MNIKDILSPTASVFSKKVHKADIWVHNASFFLLFFPLSGVEWTLVFPVFHNMSELYQERLSVSLHQSFFHSVWELQFHRPAAHVGIHHYAPAQVRCVHVWVRYGCWALTWRRVCTWGKKTAMMRNNREEANKRLVCNVTWSWIK